LIGDAEFFGTAFRLLGEQPAHVDAGADDAVIACPGAQHLPRTAAEVEHSGPRFQTQRRAERGELFGCDRVVDAVSTFSDVEDPWDVHCGKSPYQVRRSSEFTCRYEARCGWRGGIYWLDSIHLITRGRTIT
jgi:hypothetical protein